MRHRNILILAFALLLAGLIVLAGKARAHDEYPKECCDNTHCAPVDHVSFVAADPKSLPVMVVTTKLGTKPLVPQTKVMDSKDNRLHACIYRDMLFCILLPPGN